MTDIVGADWVAARLGEVRVVDVRDAWEYDGIGHLPTAVNVPFDAFRADEHAATADDGAGVDDGGAAGGGADGGTDDGGGADGGDGGEGSGADSGSTGMLPPQATFESLVREAGIDADDEVVAYDDTHGVFAARFLVTAELLGHDPDRLHLLDGDFSSWQLSHETTSDAPDVEPTAYTLDPPAATPLVDAEGVAAAVETGDVVVDTREDWEYEEGHIPGAIRLDWRELVDEETRGLLPETEARTLLESRGVTPDRRVVLYCNTARRISHTYVVLRHLGYEDLAFYEGSLTEWERLGRPLEVGE